MSGQHRAPRGVSTGFHDWRTADLTAPTRHPSGRAPTPDPTDEEMYEMAVESARESYVPRCTECGHPAAFCHCGFAVTALRWFAGYVASLHMTDVASGGCECGLRPCRIRELLDVMYRSPVYRLT